MAVANDGAGDPEQRELSAAGIEVGGDTEKIHKSKAMRKTGYVFEEWVSGVICNVNKHEVSMTTA